MTQRIASEMFDLPEPLGPTIAVISFSNVSRVFSAKDLKPWISNAFKYKANSSFFEGLKQFIINDFSVFFNG